MDHFWSLVLPFWSSGVPLAVLFHQTFIQIVLYFLPVLTLGSAFWAAASGRNGTATAINCFKGYVALVLFIAITQIAVNSIKNVYCGMTFHVDPKTPVMTMETRRFPLIDMEYIFRGTREDDSVWLNPYHDEQHKNIVCDAQEPLNGHAPTDDLILTIKSLNNEEDNIQPHQKRQSFGRVYIAERPGSGFFQASVEVYLPSFRKNCLQGYRMSIAQFGALVRFSEGMAPNVWSLPVNPPDIGMKE
ncbi:MAG: hypothetical protein LKE96_02725 [Acetobacter peroxydans]|jgi:hypothetical protein|nr:hypothetical protein [Acetobacter peroxydans]